VRSAKASGLVAADETPDAISQSELEDLAKLDNKAAEFRAKPARLEAGERVEPGPVEPSQTESGRICECSARRIEPHGK
jgi:hypothetical protein